MRENGTKKTTTITGYNKNEEKFIGSRTIMRDDLKYKYAHMQQCISTVSKSCMQERLLKFDKRYAAVLLQ